MPQQFKDLVPNETDGFLRIRLVRRDGSAALQDVYAETASPLVQNGTPFTAACANRLLILEDDGTPQINLDGGNY